MGNADQDYERSFVSRHRRKLLLLGAVAAVALTVIVYNVTGPKPDEISGGNGTTSAGEGGTLAVGALPVT